MLRGLYIASNGMLTQRKRMEVTSNNITNVETKGFKKDVLNVTTFNEVLLNRINGGNPSNGIGSMNYGIHADDVSTNFEQGSLEETRLDTDLSLEEEGFFVVQTPKGLRYTRSGNFTVDSNGYLSTQEGYRVIGMNGQVDVGTKGFSVDEMGNVRVGGAITNKLRIVNFTDPQSMNKDGGNIYDGQVIDLANPKVKQGFLENSNVDIGQELVDMIEIQRSYDANQRVLKIIDESLGKAVNDIGRL